MGLCSYGREAAGAQIKPQVLSKLKASLGNLGNLNLKKRSEIIKQQDPKEEKPVLSI